MNKAMLSSELQQYFMEKLHNAIMIQVKARHSQSEIAESLGLSQSHISAFVRLGTKASISFERLAMVMDKLGVQITVKG